MSFSDLLMATLNLILFISAHHCMRTIPNAFIANMFFSDLLMATLNFILFISAHRCMRTIPNAFIANMSFSDLLMATLNCIFNYVYMRDRRWKFGPAFCTISNFLAIVTVAASVLNLTAMSIDR